MIFKHFQLPLTNTNCDLVAALNKWINLKLFVHRSAYFNYLNPLKVWQHVSRTDVIRQEYQNILKIVHLTSLYPISNAACEHAFSVMKRIKSDWRGNLTTESMDRLIDATGYWRSWALTLCTKVTSHHMVVVRRGERKDGVNPNFKFRKKLAKILK